MMASVLLLIGVLIGAAATLGYLRLRGRLVSPATAEWSPGKPSLFGRRGDNEPKKRLFGEPALRSTETALESTDAPTLTAAPADLAADTGGERGERALQTPTVPQSTAASARPSRQAVDGTALEERHPVDVTIRARMAGSTPEPFRTLHLIAFGLLDGQRTVVAESADGSPGEAIPLSRIEAVIDVVARKKVDDLWTWLGTAEPDAIRASTATPP